MRACVLAVALMALAQPALARSHSHHSSHHFSRHHYQHHHARHVVRHHRMTPSFGEWGAVPGNTMRTPAYAMRTDASDAWGWQQPAQTFTRSERSAARQPGW